jgi:NADPH-dependent 2,4-dienoyl-CoA reductase/sulfur reductase-like enzyme
VVIGAGFIGAEFASAARAYSVDVTIVEALEVPMSRLLGTEIGATLASLHTANGVKLLTGTGFADFRATSTDSTRVGAVGLSDGTVLPADLVVVGIGASPATGWLRRWRCRALGARILRPRDAHRALDKCSRARKNSRRSNFG